MPLEACLSKKVCSGQKQNYPCRYMTLSVVAARARKQRLNVCSTHWGPLSPPCRSCWWLCRYRHRPAAWACTPHPDQSGAHCQSDAESGELVGEIQKRKLSHDWDAPLKRKLMVFINHLRDIELVVAGKYKSIVILDVYMARNTYTWVRKHIIRKVLVDFNRRK